MISLPLLLFLGIFIPLLLLFYLILKKKKLNTVELRMKFGFLYNGYQNKYFYWELINIWRQVSLFLIFIISALDYKTKLYTTLIIISYSLLLQLKEMPFISYKLNSLEEKSLFACFTTIFFACLQSDDIFPEIRKFIEILVSFSNILFITSFFINIIRVIFSKYRIFFMKYCPCFINYFRGMEETSNVF